MISTSGVSLSYGSHKLFSDVSIKFVPGNCYGLIGANGAGKSTFLKILSGENTSYQGVVTVTPGERISFLRQDHFSFDDVEVLKTVILGQLRDTDKVKVLLAQALFGNPDILLLDEPTNHLDVVAIRWLEDFLFDYDKTVIVVSHDRHFLNQVCTHMADIDFEKIQLYKGNFDFWYESSQLALKQMQEKNKKAQDKAEELKAFIARFSANASKSRQATSRKRQLEKLSIDDIKPSSRRYPFVAFKPEREAGDQLLRVENISKTIDGTKVLDRVSFTMRRGDKAVFVGDNEIS